MAQIQVVWQQSEQGMGTTPRYGIAVHFLRDNSETYAIIIDEKGKFLTLPVKVLQATKIWKDN